MARDSLRRLAAEFKQFLTAQGEDEWIAAAAPRRAAATVCTPSDTTTPQGDTLTVEFQQKKTTREMDSPAPMAKTMSTAQKTKALQTLAATIRNCSP